jgi:predicted enzyme related to lactoylglutathione lyase
MTTLPLQGRPVWAELLTTDTSAAKTFYAAVIGWTYKPMQGASNPYDIVHRPDGQSMGGIMTIPAGMNFPPHWEMYLAVENLDETMAKVQRLGGRSLSGVIEVPTVGRLSTMLDPQGGVFAIIQPAPREGAPEVEPVNGDVAWRELYTTDIAAAKTFYTDLFGWKETGAFDMGPMGTYHMFGRDFPLGGMMNKTPDMAQLPTAWGLYFRVSNADEGAAKVNSNGGKVLNGPMDVPGGDRIVNCMDPQGAAFSLHQKKA